MRRCDGGSRPSICGNTGTLSRPADYLLYGALHACRQPSYLCQNVECPRAVDLRRRAYRYPVPGRGGVAYSNTHWADGAWVRWPKIALQHAKTSLLCVCRVRSASANARRPSLEQTSTLRALRQAAQRHAADPTPRLLLIGAMALVTRQEDRMSLRKPTSQVTLSTNATLGATVPDCGLTCTYAHIYMDPRLSKPG